MSENGKSSSWESAFPMDPQKIAELQHLALSIYARQATCALYSLKQFPMVPLAFLNLAEQGIKQVWDALLSPSGMEQKQEPAAPPRPPKPATPVCER